MVCSLPVLFPPSKGKESTTEVPGFPLHAFQTTLKSISFTALIGSHQNSSVISNLIHHKPVGILKEHLCIVPPDCERKEVFIPSLMQYPYICRASLFI